MKKDEWRFQPEKPTMDGATWIYVAEEDGCPPRPRKRLQAICAVAHGTGTDAQQVKSGHSALHQTPVRGPELHKPWPSHGWLEALTSDE